MKNAWSRLKKKVKIINTNSVTQAAHCFCLSRGILFSVLPQGVFNLMLPQYLSMDSITVYNNALEEIVTLM